MRATSRCSRPPTFLTLGLLAGQLAVLLCRAAPPPVQTVPVQENLWRLIAQEDTDGDHKITVRDHTTPFALRDTSGAVLRTIEGAYPLSVLLQALTRANDHHQTRATLEQLRLDEPIVARTHRLIRESYWDALTRRIDAEHLDQVLPDPKVRSSHDYLYVPAADEAAYRYFKQCEADAARRHRFPELRVVRLPPPGQLTAAYVGALDGEHGLLSLKLETNAAGLPVRGTPYVVPGGRFNELYYWDSFFTVLGLLEDGRTDLARGMADNLIYEVTAYGEVPNANRTYYLTRSQPPFLTSIIRAVYDSKSVDRAWLQSALSAAVAEYRTVWMGPDRLIKVGPHQLNRYYDSGTGPCPEVEPGHYDEPLRPWILQAAAQPDGRLPTPLLFLREYQYCGKYAHLAADGLTLDAFFKHDRAARESGHDTTHRFDDRTADFLLCDLNALLYKYEVDIAAILESNFGGALSSLGADDAQAAQWRARAQARRQAMNDLMWDEGAGFYFDYDFARRKRSTYISATGLYPLWAGMLDAGDLVSRERARRMVSCCSATLEQFGGLAATARQSVESARTHDPRQWDYPYGWPPHQILAWQGLTNYGFAADAERLAYRWLYTIAKNAHDYNGTIPEKFNVVTGSHDVFVEYGNVGTKFAYIAPEGFAWMNASFQLGLKFLSPARLRALQDLQPPPHR